MNADQDYAVFIGFLGGLIAAIVVVMLFVEATGGW